MSISIKETVEMNGWCPFLKNNISIDVTYKKIAPLGNPHEYAVVTAIDCPYIEECSDPLKCPVALQRTLW